jgi:voltage-gated potassium channel
MRDRYNAFIERHEVAWELAFAFLAVIYVAIGFALDDPNISIDPQFALIEPLLTVVFALEFATRIAASHDRRRYLRRHWIDLVALIPVARGLRVARLLRLLRLVRAFAGLYRVVDHFERLARHRGFAAVLVAWSAVTVICCLALFAVESGTNPAINSVFDAFWWGVSTLTTVGYGDVVPVTGEGRVAASALMILGIGLFSAVTAIITSFLIATNDPEPGTDPITQIERLAALAESGSITATEFDAKRADLLARI